MPYFAITQRVVSKNHHSLKFCKLRLLQQWLCLKHTFFQNMSLTFKKGQFLLVHAAGRTEKGGYSGAHAAAKFIEKKGDRYVEQEIKKQRRHFFVRRTP